MPTAEEVGERYQERLDRAKERAERDNISVTEALAEEGAPVPESMVERARERRERGEQEEAEGIQKRYTERQERAQAFAEEHGITTTEALKVLGAPVPESMAKQATKQRLKREGLFKAGDVYVKSTPAIELLATEEPRLYKLLVNKGPDAYNNAISAEKYVTQQEAKRFYELNTELKDGCIGRISLPPHIQCQKCQPVRLFQSWLYISQNRC